VSGVQLGNVWIGVQPALGVEGDPMRLLFERDLTPHPQYAAFYQWLQHDFAANAVLHFGMHGTVEWLPGAPLGRFLKICCWSRLWDHVEIHKECLLTPCPFFHDLSGLCAWDIGGSGSHVI